MTSTETEQSNGRHPPAEDGDRDEVVWASHSSLTTHRACPQKYYYGHLRHLERLSEAEPQVERDMGSWWHALQSAESLQRGRRLGTLCWTPETIRTVNHGPEIPSAQATVEEVLATSQVWWNHQNRAFKQAWIDRIGDDTLPERLRYVYERWQEEWREENAIEQPLATELRWERELPVPPSEQERIGRIVLVGYVDEVYLDTKRNLVVVRDFKISKTLGTQNVADDMMDSQLQLYAWGASPTITGWGRGRIRATGYDRSRMKKPMIPELTLMGNLSQRVTDFDLHTYRTWAATHPAYPGRTKDGSQAGTYDEDPVLVAKLSGPTSRSIWYQRTLSPLNPNLIRAHLRAAVDSAVDMSHTRARALEHHEAARNLTTGCRWCDFSTLCRAQMIGGPDGEYELEDHRLRVNPDHQ